MNLTNEIYSPNYNYYLIAHASGLGYNSIVQYILMLILMIILLLAMHHLIMDI